ncbi:hypothetical protein AYI68_g717 [Smittium mucronatum]|uniref:Uncharacterized protein n=1 Tax=Smittium mucronatum TaxID=133383 RepID=A0A1R0H7E3_9FUNG|nr:hypothetical protein AYI68_g717 [Smittium mucronatum]
MGFLQAWDLKDALLLQPTRRCDTPDCGALHLDIENLQIHTVLYIPSFTRFTSPRIAVPKIQCSVSLFLSKNRKFPV